jgi:pyridinium-3,5-biscarboxylic acid mononucleotide sulfurtransferase
MDAHVKMENLKGILKQFQNLMVAFSGGVDSTFLLAASKAVLKENVVAVTGVSPIHPAREILHAKRLAKKLGVRHLVIETREMEIEQFVRNIEDRCYVCKKHLILEMKKIAEKMHIAHIAHGANADDLNDFRPGLAAADALGVVSPLIDVGLTKEEIRQLSREMGLETWDKPSAPCLATRLPHGARITGEVLKKIEAAENILIDHGVTLCRIRHHGDTARIETDENGRGILIQADRRKDIVRKIKEKGYAYVCLDLDGYVQGNMNRSIPGKPLLPGRRKPKAL